MSKLVLLSGWGIDARIWQPLQSHWPEGVSVSTPDWPGYGDREPLADPQDLAALAATMAADLDPDAVWVGWSLGGLLAAHLLAYLPTPRALVMLGMGPRFVSDSHNSNSAVSRVEFKAFQRAFHRDAESTWQHFLRWQLSGEPAPRPAFERLLDLIGQVPPATHATLLAGLVQLGTLDATAIVANPPCPMLRCQGVRDPLASREQARGGQDSDKWATMGSALLIEEAGHCPQLSQPVALVGYLSDIAYRHAPSAGRPEETS
ncbi:alpha/beta fold hydrolase [Litchfieldella rifensis]|uniref:Alpha/beta fold hydrolase n=1 Tax=Litchfieldella rifensis TaxID=762643 RepID=A0ABV7LUX2_9GAMM